MVTKLMLPPTEDGKKRFDGFSFGPHAPLELNVTSRTRLIFDLIIVDGQKHAKSFLVKHPALWYEDPVFQAMKASVTSLEVVNDVTERRISLVQAYSSKLTKDEGFRFLLRLVAGPSETVRVPTKNALMKSRFDSSCSSFSNHGYLVFARVLDSNFGLTSFYKVANYTQ